MLRTLKTKYLLFLSPVLIMASSCDSNVKEEFSCMHFEGVFPTDSSMYSVLDQVTRYYDSLHELKPEEMVYIISCLCDDEDTIFMISSYMANTSFLPEENPFGLTYKDILFVVKDYSECDSIFFLPSGTKEEYQIKQKYQERCLIDDSWNEWTYQYEHGRYTPISYYINGLYWDINSGETTQDGT